VEDAEAERGAAVEVNLGAGKLGIERTVAVETLPVTGLVAVEDLGKSAVRERSAEEHGEQDRQSDRVLARLLVEPDEEGRLARFGQPEGAGVTRPWQTRGEEPLSGEHAELSVDLTASDRPVVADLELRGPHEFPAGHRPVLAEEAEQCRLGRVQSALTVHCRQLTIVHSRQSPTRTGGRVAQLTSGDVAVEVRGLEKTYGDLQAVCGIDLEIRRGEVFALLGPNGAGKTTTVEILEGYRRRDSGHVTVLGIDPGRQRAQLKPRIGIVLQSTGVDRYLTVAETVAMYAGFYPSPRPVDEVIAVVGLEEKRDARVLKLSGGQQRRLDVAIALAGDPDLLFLDEPTTGFDPSARREAWEVVKNLAGLGKTVLLTTHYMDEAQYLADRVSVIAAGRIVATGPPSSLAGRDSARARVRLRLPEGVELPAELGDRRTSDGTTEFVPDDLGQVLHDLTGWALAERIDVSSLEIVRPTLEDVYLELTSSSAADGRVSVGSRPEAVLPEETGSPREPTTRPDLGPAEGRTR